MIRFAALASNDPIALRVSSSYAARARDPLLARWLSDLTKIEKSENWDALEVLCSFPHADVGAALSLAARRGRSRELERVVSKRRERDVDWAENLARAARAAANSGREEALGVLLRYGVAEDDLGTLDSVLLDACCADTMESDAGARARCVELVLKSGADANCRGTRQGWKPLHAAAKRNDVNAIEMLVQAGADIDVRYHNGKTPMFVACEWGSAESARTLLKFGASLSLGAVLYTDHSLGAVNEPVLPRDVAVGLHHVECVQVIDEALRRV